jgi:hypothetical protein
VDCSIYEGMTQREKVLGLWLLTSAKETTDALGRSKVPAMLAPFWGGSSASADVMLKPESSLRPMRQSGLARHYKFGAYVPFICTSLLRLMRALSLPSQAVVEPLVDIVKFSWYTASWRKPTNSVMF